jgi:diguanylate cyclase (GGDEF)-like protein
MVNREPAASLRKAIAIFGLLVAPVGFIWAAVGLILGAREVTAIGLVATVFGAWLIAEKTTSRRRTAQSIATRVALMTQFTAVCAVAAEPTIAIPIAMGSLIPVVMALAYVERRTLTSLMICSAVVGMFATIAPSVIPWGSHFGNALDQIMPTATLIIVYGLFQLFLYNASVQVTDTASELRHALQMSHDLAATLDPQEVGNLIASHIATASNATDCALSTWDRVDDRLVTYGYYPVSRRDRLEPAYDLADYPATKAVLLTQKPTLICADDPEADPREIAYLSSIGQKSLVILPLVSRGEAIGIVELTSPKLNAFEARQIELARILAREAAMNLDNARLHEEITAQAYRDTLTSLANRARLQERLDHALSRLRGRSPNHAALLFVDLDHFKLVNDRFGHAKGDRVLQVVGERIRACIRPGDTAARMGGDEFAILLEEVTTQDEALVVAERVLEALGRPIDLGEAAPVVGGSVGLALSGIGGENGDDLLRSADVAMYAAKAAGRAQIVIFRSDLMDLAAARSELAALLRGAANRDEIKVHFQPIVELESGTPIGLEALVRWQPDGHLIHMPAEFIELAEETGEILSIGRWVIVEACRQMRSWQDRYDRPDLRLYVNLSARQFKDPSLVSMVSSALRTSGLEAGSLTLEITESSLLTQSTETLDRVAELRKLGVRLAIDDFGTGYSSLGYLRAFRVDELKIDRTFVSEPSRTDGRVLSRAIVELGRALSLELIAEGIETAEQATWFTSLGCRYGQGFLYARPMPPVEVERYLRRRQTVSKSPTDSGTGAGAGTPAARATRQVAGAPRQTAAPRSTSARMGGITSVAGGRKKTA